MKKIYNIIAFLLFLSAQSVAQQYTLSGYVQSARNNEALFNASIFVADNPEYGTLTNEYGFYSLTLPEGDYEIIVSYLGYNDESIWLELHQNEKWDFQLLKGIDISEIVVRDERKDENVSSTEMGKLDLSTETVKKLPAIFGEIDVLKALQLLPGVITSGEGSSGFNVRGGGADQNLILMDEAVVYNSGHLLGFFSVFNADAIKNTTLIKGSMPARYGGRLSSVVDVQMKEGNSKDFGAAGGIGLISSRLMVEGPIVKDKGAFLLAGRRTYLMDIVQPFIKNTNYAGTNYYFYDFNAKLNYKISDKDRIFISGYFGRDIFKFQSETNDLTFNFPYGNKTLSMRWNHLFSDKMFMNITAVYNDYMYKFGGGQSDFKLESTSGVRDIGVKARWEYFPSVNHTITFGADILHHTLTPNLVSGETVEEVFGNDLVTKYGASMAAYIMDDWKVNTRLSFLYGLRLSLFGQLGPYSHAGEEFKAYEFMKEYFHPQPRLSARYKLDHVSSIKADISYTVQYLHLVSNSSSTLPVDIWVPSTRLIKPQENLQYSLGYFRNFFDNRYEFSTQLYYRSLFNQIDYRDDYVASIMEDIENAFVIGTGRAYGAEIFFKKQRGQLTGWLSYTLSRTLRTFPDIENGRMFPASYDKPHNLSLVLTYDFSPALSVSSTFVYGTGRWYTPVEEIYAIENSFHVLYGPRNSAKLPDYHRMDLSVTYIPSAGKQKKWQSSWNLSIYNVYNRKNPFFIFTGTSTDQATGQVSNKSTMVSIFPLIPSISWNFKWNQE